MHEKGLVELFNSKSRVRILKLFLNNPDTSFSASEITKKTKLPPAETRKEIRKLIKIGLIKTV